MKTPSDGWDDDERDIPEGLARELAGAGPRAGEPPLEMLRAAGEDVLSKEAEASARWYLAQHPGRRALVDNLNELAALDQDTADRIRDRVRHETRDSVPARRALPAWWRVAAAFGAIAILGSAWWMARRGPDPVTTAAIESPATLPVTQAPAASSAPATAPPTFLVPLERPDVRISLRAMTWRGQGPDNPVLVALKPALEAFRAGDYARADKEFSTVATRYPDLVEVALYQGVTRLFLNDVSGALEQLNRAQAIDDPSFADDVTWFLAAAHERSGDVAAATRELQSLCARRAAGRACQVLAARP